MMCPILLGSTNQNQAFASSVRWLSGGHSPPQRLWRGAPRSARLCVAHDRASPLAPARDPQEVCPSALPWPDAALRRPAHRHLTKVMGPPIVPPLRRQPSSPSSRGTASQNLLLAIQKTAHSLAFKGIRANKTLSASACQSASRTQPRSRCARVLRRAPCVEVCACAAVPHRES
jgi:hypothetical protein